MNRISINSGLTGAELVTPLHWSAKLGMVPNRLIYGLNTAKFESKQGSSFTRVAIPLDHPSRFAVSKVKAANGCIGP